MVLFLCLHLNAKCPQVSHIHPAQANTNANSCALTVLYNEGNETSTHTLEHTQA